MQNCNIVLMKRMFTEFLILVSMAFKKCTSYGLEKCTSITVKKPPSLGFDQIPKDLRSLKASTFNDL